VTYVSIKDEESHRKYEHALLQVEAEPGSTIPSSLQEIERSAGI
jgi:hypothetical protein